MNRALAVVVAFILGLRPVELRAQENDDEMVISLMIQRLQRAETVTNEHPSAGIGELRAALRDFAELAPEVAGHAKAQEARSLAQLALARAALALNDDQLANDTMDGAIRTARGDVIPSHLFGPNLERLHRERAAALHAQGYASLEIRCRTPCDVYLNERRAGTRENRLELGDYRLWIRARDPEHGEPERRTLTLARSGEIVVVDYPSARETPKITEPKALPKPLPKVDVRPPPRLLPRWLEILGIAAGTAMVGGGVTLVVLDDWETNEFVETESGTQQKIVDLEYAGAALIAAGATALLAGIVTLALDRKRAKRRSVAGPHARTRP